MTNRPIDAIHALINHTPDCSTDAYRADDIHDAFQTIARELLCDIDLSFHDLDKTAPINLYRDQFDAIHDAICTILDDEHSRDDLSELLLSFSLCPMHFTDYAICFDDDDEECIAIRACFPSHDT